MNRLVFSKEAKKDLGDIWKYTFYKWSEAQADKYYRHLVEACKEISKTPSLGKSYDNFRWIVWYKVWSSYNFLQKQQWAKY